MDNTLVRFDLVLRAYKNALRAGYDLSRVLARACTSESFDRSELALIARFQ